MDALTCWIVRSPICRILYWRGVWKKSGQLVKTSVTGFTFLSRSHDAAIRVYDAAGNVIETHEHKGDFREP
jgi:hypothetical protein